MREQADQELFDTIADRYARKDVVASSSLARKNQLLFALQPILDQSPNLGTVVDVGCGVGAPARYLEGHYERYVGIDQSEEMIKAAATFNRGNPRAEFMAKNIKSRHLPQNVADVILSDGALHHITELDHAMGSLARIAKPGAFLVVREPQTGNPLVQTMRRVRGIVDSAYSEEQVFFRERDLRSLFASHNITDLSVRFQGFLSPPFAQVVMHPQALTVRLSKLAVSIDRWLNAHLPAPLQKLSFNIVVIGRFPE